MGASSDSSAVQNCDRQPNTEQIQGRTQIEVPQGSVSTGTHATSTAPATDDYPDYFMCPISKKVMVDPVICSDGHTYDRYDIEKWLKENSTSPVTHAELPDKNLIPNLSIKTAIKSHRSKKS